MNTGKAWGAAVALGIAGTAVVGLDAGTAAADPAAITQQYNCNFPSPAGRQSVTLRLDSAIPTTAVVGKPTPAFPLTADAPVNGGIAASAFLRDQQCRGDGGRAGGRGRARG